MIVLVLGWDGGGGGGGGGGVVVGDKKERNNFLRYKDSTQLDGC